MCVAQRGALSFKGVGAITKPKKPCVGLGCSSGDLALRESTSCRKKKKLPEGAEVRCGLVVEPEAITDEVHPSCLVGFASTPLVPHARDGIAGLQCDSVRAHVRPFDEGGAQTKGGAR